MKSSSARRPSGLRSFALDTRVEQRRGPRVVADLAVGHRRLTDAPALLVDIACPPVIAVTFEAGGRFQKQTDLRKQLSRPRKLSELFESSAACSVLPSCS